MKCMLLHLTFIIGLTFCLVGAADSEVREQTVSHVPSYLPENGEGLLRENRVRFAKWMLYEIEGALGAIPRVSPSEEKWILDESERLDKMMKDTQDKEVFQRWKQQHQTFFWSDEHVRWKVTDALGALQSRLRRILEKDKDPQVNEMAFWAGLLMILRDHDTQLCLERLEEKGVIPLQHHLTVWTSLWHKTICYSVVCVNVAVMEEALREADIVLTNTATWKRLAPKSSADSVLGPRPTLEE